MSDPADIRIVVKGKDTRRQLRMKLDRAEARLDIAIEALRALDADPYYYVRSTARAALDRIESPGAMGNET